MDKKPIEKVIKLVAKTGLFFAHADGEYDVREKKFIESFIDKLAAIGPVDEVKAEIEGSLNRAYTLDEIVAETKDLLEGFNKPEQEVIKLTMRQFVINVINSDCVEKKTETELFKAWILALE